MSWADINPTGKACLLIGIGCVAFSASSHWYLVPIEHGSSGWELIGPAHEASFKLCALLACVVSAVSLIFWGNTRVAVHGVAIALLAGLSFPSHAVVYDIQTAVPASWFQQAHSNLSWLGGDIALSQGVSEDLYLSDVLMSDSPYIFRAAPSPLGLRGRAGLRELSDILEWLGFADSFAAFVRRGWFVGVLGSLLLLAAAGVSSASKRSFFRVASVGVSGWMLLGCYFLLSPVWRAGGHLQRAEELTHGGLYSIALEEMHDAGREVPIIRFDTRFVAQAGLLDARLGLTDAPSAQLYVARVREAGGSGPSLKGVLWGILRDDDAPAPVRREAARALARYGYLALNTGDTRGGVVDLLAAKEVLSNDPKLILALQVASLRSGDHASIERSVEEIVGLYEHVNLPSGESVVAFGLGALARSAWADGLDARAFEVASARGRPR